MNTFSLKLLSYMIENHPDRIGETQFIEERGAHALHTFSQASRSGYTVTEAMAQANEVLFRGLHFSPYNMIRDIITEELGYQGSDDEDTGIFIMQMVAYTRPVIESYLSEVEPDNFIGTAGYDNAYAHLTQLIQQYIIDNGL